MRDLAVNCSTWSVQTFLFCTPAICGTSQNHRLRCVLSVMLTIYLSRLVSRWNCQVTFWLFLALSVAAIPTSYNIIRSDEHHPMCTNDYDWTGAMYDPNDCLSAVQRLENTDLKFFKTIELEFLAPGATRTSSLPTIRTPRKYTVGSCTLVIAMLSTLPPWSLPGQRRRRQPYAPSDTSRFSYIRSISSWVDRTCLEEGKQLGWCATGENYDIGVFIWSTASTMNKEVISSNNIYYKNISTGSDTTMELARILEVDGVIEHSVGTF